MQLYNACSPLFWRPRWPHQHPRSIYMSVPPPDGCHFFFSISPPLTSHPTSPLEVTRRRRGRLCETLTSHFQIDLKVFCYLLLRRRVRDKSQRSVPNTNCTKLVAWKKKKKRRKYEMCRNINHKSLSAANHNQPLKKHAEWRGEILLFLTHWVLIKRKETITLIHWRAAASLSHGGVGDFLVRCWKDASVKRTCVCFSDGSLMTGCD